MHHLASRALARRLALLLPLSATASSLACSSSRAPEADTTAPQRASSPTAHERLSLAHVEVTLPTRDDTFSLRDRATGLAVGVRLGGASLDASARALGPRARSFDDSPARGWRHELHTLEHGLEDLVLVPARPALEELRYELTLEHVGGLRLVAGALELLDGGGAPRLRVAPPFVLDARGVARPAALALTDCPVTRDPRAPWRRATLAPPARCTLTVRWGEALGGPPLEYPVLVDPEWTSASSLMVGRYFHTASVVGGLVLAWGGTAPGGPSHAELFDPVTGTWAIAGQPLFERTFHTATSAGTEVLAFGGTDASESVVLDTIERYDLETGQFELVGTMLAPRAYHTSTRLLDGRTLTVGGHDLTYQQGAGEPGHALSELFDPSTGLVEPAGDESPRLSHVATRLADGRVLVAGGDVYADVTNDPAQVTDSAALFDPTTGAWTPTGSLVRARADHLVAVLADGRPLVAGGWQNGLGGVLQTETYDPATGQWTLTPGALDLMRLGAAVAPLANGGVLVAGGCCTTATSEVFWPLDGTWSFWDPLPAPRFAPSSTLLPDGRTLLVGGHGADGVLQTSTYVLELAPLGAPSLRAVLCESGVASGGVCCDAPCEARCQSCLASEKGHGVDGLCEPVSPDALDPKAECVDELGPSCGMTGRCTEGGECALYEAGTTCATEGCTFEAGQCDGSGACLCPPPACSADEQFYGDADCAPYKCSPDGCPSECSSSEACLAPYLCDRTGHCVLPTSAPARGGCSVGPSPAPRDAGAALALASLALLSTMARRRRAR